MKKRGKKLLAGAAALAMSCSMVTGWANGVTITGVKVLSDPVRGTGEPEVAATYTAEQIAAGAAVTLSTAQMLQVTVALNDGTAESAAAAGDVTFLSNIANAQTLNNDSIQYVDQQTVSTTDGTATITFRPRMSIGTQGVGSFIAKAGGTDVATTAEFNYTVETPKVDMRVDPALVTIKSGESASFTVPAGMTNVVVKEGSTALDSSAVSYSETTLTITGLTEVKTHNLVISAAGYNDKAVTVVVNSAVVEIPKDDVGNVDTALGAGLDNVTQGGTSAELPAKAGDYDVAYSIPDGDPNKDKVTLTDNTIALKSGVFAAKVTVSASVGKNGQVKDTKDIYLVAEGTTQIAFGNLGLISDSTGADAFTTQGNVTSLGADVKADLKANVLNYALDRRDHAADLGNVVKSAVDYDLNGDVTLSEYRMLKLMLEGTAGFTANDMVRERAGWISKNGSTSTPESN